MSNENGLQLGGSRVAGLEGEYVGLRHVKTTGIGFAGVNHSHPEAAIEINQTPHVVPGMSVKKFVLGQVQARFRLFAPAQGTAPG